jgi:hypothetical protein
VESTSGMSLYQQYLNRKNTKISNESIFGQWFLIYPQSMAIDHARYLGFNNGMQLYKTIVINSVNLVWSRPMSTKFTYKVFEPRIIQKGPISIMELLLNEFVMPRFLFLLNSRGLVQGSLMNFIKFIDLVQAMFFGLREV